MKQEDAVRNDIGDPLKDILMQLPIEELIVMKEILSDGIGNLAIQRIINNINTIIILESGNTEFEGWR